MPFLCASVGQRCCSVRGSPAGSLGKEAFSNLAKTELPNFLKPWFRLIVQISLFLAEAQNVAELLLESLASSENPRKE